MGRSEMRKVYIAIGLSFVLIMIVQSLWNLYNKFTIYDITVLVIMSGIACFYGYIIVKMYTPIKPEE